MQVKLKSAIRIMAVLGLFMALTYNASGQVEASSTENTYINDIFIEDSSSTSFGLQICTRNESAINVKFTVTANGASNTLTYSPTIQAGKCQKVYTWGFSHFDVDEGMIYSVKAQIDKSSVIYSESLTIATKSYIDLIVSEIKVDSNNYLQFVVKRTKGQKMLI